MRLVASAASPFLVCTLWLAGGYDVPVARASQESVAELVVALEDDVLRPLGGTCRG